MNEERLENSARPHFLLARACNSLSLSLSFHLSISPSLSLSLTGEEAAERERERDVEYGYRIISLLLTMAALQINSLT
jgi:hypothetical protein